MKHYQVRACRSTPASAADWAQAGLLTGFSLPWEDRPAPRTEFRALWTAGHLHFWFAARDSTPLTGSGATVRERVLDSDRVEIFLAPDLSLDPYYCLEIAPSGEVLAYRARFYRQMDWDWRCPGLEVRAESSGDAFQITGSLPLDTLRRLGVLRPGANQFFAGLYRADFAQEPGGALRRSWLPWVNPGTQRADFHVPASFGVLELTATEP